MGGSSKEPPDKPVDKNYKCHPKVKFNFVACLVCDEAYHVSDFNKSRKAKYLRGFYGLCPEHADLDLTSNIDEGALSLDARKIIAHVKLFEKEACQAELLSNLSTTNKDQFNPHNIAMTDEEDFVAKENQLLKQLNQELIEKNNILRHQLDSIKNSNNNNNTASYAQVLMNEVSQNVQVPNILIKAKGVNNKDAAFPIVVEKIQNDIVLPIKKLFKNKNGTVAVKCHHKEDVSRTKELLQEKIGDDFEVNMQEIKNPRLKIVGIQNRMNKEELETDINMRNFYKFNSGCIAIHSYDSANDTRCLIIELSAELYSFVKSHNFRIFVGHQNCRAYDDLNIKPCHNCGRFGHNGNKCINPTVCLICAGDHRSIVCDNEEKLCCVNCLFGNTHLGKNRDTNHMAIDSSKCEVLKYKINSIILETDYPSRPIIPTYISNMGKIRFAALPVDQPSRSNNTCSASSTFVQTRSLRNRNTTLQAKVKSRR